MGIPVEGQRGVGGGYRVRPGFRLPPPLMLSGDEAVVVVLGLLAARRQDFEVERGLGRRGADEDPSRSCPTSCAAASRRSRRRSASPPPSGQEAPVGSDVALLVAGLIRRGRRLAFSYRAFTGDETARDVSPHGLVVHSGRWYLAAYDHGRADRRTFRVDRMRKVALADGPWLAPPTGFDAKARQPLAGERPVALGGRRAARSHRARSRLAHPGHGRRARRGGTGTLLRMRVGSLDWMAGVSPASAAASRSTSRPSCARASASSPVASRRRSARSPVAPA